MPELVRAKALVDGVETFLACGNRDSELLPCAGLRPLTLEVAKQEVPCNSVQPRQCRAVGQVLKSPQAEGSFGECLGSEFECDVGMDACSKPGMDRPAVSAVELGKGLGIRVSPLDQFGVGLH